MTFHDFTWKKKPHYFTYLAFHWCLPKSQSLAYMYLMSTPAGNSGPCNCGKCARSAPFSGTSCASLNNLVIVQWKWEKICVFIGVELYRADCIHPHGLYSTNKIPRSFQWLLQDFIKFLFSFCKLLVANPCSARNLWGHRDLSFLDKCMCKVKIHKTSWNTMFLVNPSELFSTQPEPRGPELCWKQHIVDLPPPLRINDWQKC